MDTKGLTSFQNAREIVESEAERNRKIRIPKRISSSEVLDVLHKVKRPTENKTEDCNSGTKEAHILLLSCFINNHYGFFGHQAKVTQKVRKSVNNIKIYFKQFFTFLKRTFAFIISLFRATYRSSSPDVFTKKVVLIQVSSIFTEEYPWSSL